MSKSIKLVVANALGKKGSKTLNIKNTRVVDTGIKITDGDMNTRNWRKKNE